MYLETYRKLLPEMNEFQLREQKRLFENNYQMAGSWHPVDKIIYKMIIKRLDMFKVLNSVN